MRKRAMGAFWSSSGESTRSSSSDPDDARRNLKQLESILQRDRAWLEGVEASATIDEQTKVRKKELEEWACDAEDVVDEWKYEQQRAMVEARRYDLLPDPSFSRRVNDLWQARRGISEYDRGLRLRSGEGLARGQTRGLDPPPSTSLIGERYVYDRDDDRDMLLGFLLEGAMEESLAVVPIVGTVGVGKTTFVRYIYNDQRVSEGFVVRGWVSASRLRGMMELLNSIGESLAKKACRHSQLDSLQNFLRDKIVGRRFLLVLDDVRNEILCDWEQLLATFRDCAKGSVIVLTTQDEQVAKKTKTVDCSYFLESLSINECSSLFKEHAFGCQPTDVTRREELGKRIAKECEGLPLVAKAVGVWLRDEDVERWEEFLQGDMWDEVVPELRLSYCHLPAHLKRCFVYCSMFPKGYLFRKDELILLWMAQGFIEERGKKSLEDVGVEYFDELLSQSFFRKSKAEIEAFVMPNPLHALAKSIANSECLTVEESYLGSILRNLQKARHLSLTLSNSNSELTTKSLSFETHLHPFLVVQSWPSKNTVVTILSDITSLKLLRVLDVRNTDIEAFPDKIGNLKHLRYLNFSGTKIENISAAVFKLYNLQTLDLSRTDVGQLPDAIGNLTKLRHLHLNVTKIRKLPESIGNLSELQTLHLGVTKVEELPTTIGNLKGLKFLCLNVGKVQKPSRSIHELVNLQTLELQGAEVHTLFAQEQLNEHSDQIIQNQDVRDMYDSNIDCLRCRRANDSGIQGSSSNDPVMENAVLENLRPHTSVRKLDLKFYGGTIFPMWMGDPAFSKLSYVVLKNCTKCKDLPQLGLLPQLKELDIDGTSVKQVGRQFCGHGKCFVSLKKLSFQNMYKWEKWDGLEKDDFPYLDELTFFNCPKLEGLPDLPSSLSKLKVERCAVKAIPTIEYLMDLTLCDCDNLSKLPYLKSLCNLTLVYCDKLESLPAIPSLEMLWVGDCEQLSSCNISLLGLEIRELSSTSFLAMPKETEVDDLDS